MTAANDAAGQEAVAWAKSMVDQAVQSFIDQGVVDTAMLEAKPSWGIPPRVLIAMLREQGAPQHSFWLICGAEVHFDYLASSAAATAREAARHFALKWHLEAARLRDSASLSEHPGAERNAENPGAGNRLQRQAELLYRLVDDDALWRQDWPAG